MKMKNVSKIHRSSAAHWVGDGFPVRSVFDYNGLGRELSPFLLLDYAPPHEFAPTHAKRGVGGHPHKGFETVTIVYQGELAHRDSSGGGGTIGPGDVQWMTAGNGILHEEFHSPAFSKKGGTLQMLQLWVNLRAQDKSAKPNYQTLVQADIPTVALPNGRGAVRVIAGEFAGRRGPAKTFTPINVWDAQVSAGEAVELPVPDGHTTTLILLSGELELRSTERAGEGDLVIFERAGEAIQFQVMTDSKFVLLSGEPINEPIFGQGPFVMNSRSEIQQAFAEFQMGKMGRLD
jgi:quercetin 2,3-dioxygenase